LIQPEAEVCLNAEAREGRTAKIGKNKMPPASARNIPKIWQDKNAYRFSARRLLNWQ